MLTFNLRFLLSILFLSILAPLCSLAQETFYVPDSALVYFGNKVPAGIFGFVRSNGNISMAENAQLYFLGKIWINENNATLTDSTTINNSSKGGRVHFYQPNPVFGNLGQQILQANYTDTVSNSTSFSNITIDNNSGVILTSDINVLKNTHFRRGHIYLNFYDFYIGDSLNQGLLSGYDEHRYFVTTSNVVKGFLRYRSVASGSMAAFPIGPNDKVYSPLQIVNRGNNDQFFARAFEKVYSNATNGSLIADSTLQLTWNLGKAAMDNAEVIVSLQHDMSIEDPVFRENRERSYISIYKENLWDKPFFRSLPQMPGNITSTFSIASAITNTRKLYLNTPLFLTKKVSKANKSFEIPNVFSPNGDNINDRWNVKGLAEFENCLVEIYNRYGQMLFRSNGYKQPWDGTYKGNPVPVATYYYIINLNNGDRPLGGSVTLLR